MLKTLRKRLDGKAACFDLNKRKGKRQMKDYMKITGVLAVLLSMTGVVKAEEKISGEVLSEEERARGYEMADYLLLSSQKYLTKEEREKFCALVSVALARKNRFNAQHPENRKKARSFRLSYFWFEAFPYLRNEERETYHTLVNKAHTRGHRELSGEKREEAEKKEIGSIGFYVRPYLTHEEKEQIDALLHAGLERSIVVESKKYEEVLSKKSYDKRLPEAQDILGHLWFSARATLTAQENKTIDALINKGLERDPYKPSFVKEDTEKLVKFASFQNPFIKEDEELAKKRLGHLWFSVRPYLTEKENKTLSHVILKGFDRSLQVESHPKIHPSHETARKG